VAGCQNRHRPNKLATLWKKKKKNNKNKNTHTHVTQKVKIYSEIQTQNHITTVAHHSHACTTCDNSVIRYFRISASIAFTFCYLLNTFCC